MMVTKLNGVELIGPVDIGTLHIEEGDTLSGYFDKAEGVNEWDVVPVSSVKSNGFNIVTPVSKPDIATVLKVSEQ